MNIFEQVDNLLKERQAAREHKDYALLDRLRADLAALGCAVIDAGAGQSPASGFEF